MKKTEFVYGVHSCRHVLEKSFDKIVRIWFFDDSKSASLNNLKKLAEQQSLKYEECSRSVLDKLSNFERHQGVVIEKHIDEFKNGDLETLLSRGSKNPKLFLVLDHIQDPHNLGACLRSADACGVMAVIIPKDNSAKITSTVAKIASGAVETIPIIKVVNLVRTLKQLQQSGIWVVGTSDDVPKTIYDLDLTIPLALVIGSEGKGMKKSVRDSCDYLVSIPMSGTVESLNVSVATGVALYEIQRQRIFSDRN